jgi:hypothetical protein
LKSSEQVIGKAACANCSAHDGVAQLERVDAHLAQFYRPLAKGKQDHPLTTIEQGLVFTSQDQALWCLLPMVLIVH